MIDFLLDYDIKQETINKMEKKYDKTLLYLFNCNEYEIKDIIVYLKGMNISCIDDILVGYIELFLKTYEEFVALIEKYDIPKLVETINRDYHVLEEILN